MHGISIYQKKEYIVEFKLPELFVSGCKMDHCIYWIYIYQKKEYFVEIKSPELFVSGAKWEKWATGTKVGLQMEFNFQSFL